jgi:hypothetical protein
MLVTSVGGTTEDRIAKADGQSECRAESLAGLPSTREDVEIWNEARDNHE